MKKIILLLLAFVTVSTAVNAQILRAEELEKYAKEKYGEKWVDAATNLGSQLTLDKNNGITYVQVIEAPGKTQAELYVLLNYWFTATFNDANSVIKLNDKELGTIIAHGYVSNIAGHLGGTNAYDVSINPVIKCDIKDGKVRVTYSVPFYNVIRMAGGGWDGLGCKRRRRRHALCRKMDIGQVLPLRQKRFPQEDFKQSARHGARLLERGDG